MFGSVEEERVFHENAAWCMLFMALPTFITLAHVTRSQTLWGKTFDPQNPSNNPLYLGPPYIPARLAWFIFESPNLIWSYLCWKLHQAETPFKPLCYANRFLLSLFVVHYVQRSILYPALLSKNTKTMPFSVVLSACIYTSWNGYLQARALCRFTTFPDGWINHPQFLFGVLLFLVGMAINLQSDAILRRLREQNTTYQIPHGGLFDLVSAPHFFGEIIEWTGFAIANQFSLASVSFLAFTAANLIPRGVGHHAWYHEKFKDDYPKERRAIIPFIW